MAKKKVTLAWITNPATRHATLNRRHIPCVRYFKALPEAEQSKKRVDQEGSLCQSILKIRNQIKRRLRENRELEMDVLLNQGLAGRRLTSVGFEDAMLLKQLIEEKAKAVKDKLAEMRASQMKAKEELITMANQNLMMVEWINPNPNPSPIKEEKQVLGLFRGGRGYLDDVITHHHPVPGIGFGSYQHGTWRIHHSFILITKVSDNVSARASSAGWWFPTRSPV